jgi:hypothetical protein
MRRLITLVCLGAVSAVLVGAARGVVPEPGSLSVERGRGLITLEVRGNVLGRLANGSITVTDRTPNDPYLANVTGKRVVIQRRLTPTKLFIRGQGLRFNMLGGSYKIVIRGSGVSLSAVGRGHVWLDGEPRFPGDDTGVYSIDGVDCGDEPESCDFVPDEAVRERLGKAQEEEPSRTGASAR